MATQWLRRAFALAACASALLLAACGSGSIESRLHPTRVVAFGDAFADLGQNGARYTINDGTVNNWSQFVAQSFLLTLAPSASGGLSYATGNARVLAKPDAAGNGATATVKEQIDAFLATSAFTANDLVLVNAGISDIVVQTSAFLAGSQTRDQLLANVGQAGRDLGAQVRRLVAAGAQHVVVVGPYNLGKSPWAIQTGQTAVLTEASGRFNEQLLVSVVDIGANVLYVDAALYFNLATAAPSAYTLSNATDLACISIDPGPGIGTGSGQINSNLCTASTLIGALDAQSYVFADRLYVTPVAQRLFGEYAYGRIRARW
jgi:phospholipase/lecithinase/hemolysin